MERYIRRHAENTVRKLSKMFGAVLVAGPRQVGKTTMLREMTGNIRYVSLDDGMILRSAKESPGTFFKDHIPPVFIDEIQRAPELFLQMKLQIDDRREKGLFYLSGSQQLHMMKNVSESLAGRIGLLNLPGFSMREMSDVETDLPFLPADAYWEERLSTPSVFDYDAIWQLIQRGSMPELFDNPDYDWQYFHAAYVNTYIERDVRELSEVGDTLKFLQFLTATAASTGQLLNMASLARDVGISQPTAQRWLSILTASHIVYLLKPYSNNITKRAVKTPKLYFMDTGLAAYLTKWTNAEVLKNGAMSGAFFESFVISEIMKSYYNRGVIDPPLYFYRDKDMNEIDLLIEDSGILYPLEIKKHADPGKKDIRAFRQLDKITGMKRGPGGVICMYDQLITLEGNDKVIPVQYL